MSRTSDLGIDLGKTTCRVRLHGETGVIEATGPGAPGLAAGSAGVAAALAGIEAALAAIPEAALASVTRVGVGAAGAESNLEAATALATAVARRCTAGVTLVTDVIAAHAGALGGAAGTVVVAGTGAVAYRLDGAGQLHRADGWGIWLGDFGSGRWIGQEGLRRALRARDGVDPPTALGEAAVAVAGSLEALPRYVSDSAAPERVLAAFAPVVLAHAETGDAVAGTIVAEAVGYLADTAAACAVPAEPLCLVGGLTASPFFTARLTQALAQRGLTTVPTLADAMEGARLIAARPDLPHERFAIRVHP